MSLRSLTVLRILWCEVASLAVILTGDISLWLSLLILALILLIGLAPETSPWLGPARTASSLLAIFYLVFFPLDWLVLSGQLIFAVVHLTFYLKLHSLLHLRTDRERNRLHLLCFFEMLAAASMTVNALFVLPLILFVLVGSLVLILDQAMLRPGSSLGGGAPGPPLRPALRTALVLGLVVLAAAGSVFVVLPRSTYGGFQVGGEYGITTTGLTGEIRLGDFGEIKLSQDVVMRLVAEGGSFVSPPRWRGAAYDRYFDGRWEQSFTGLVLLPPSGRWNFLLDRPSDAFRVANEVFLEPLDTDVLFLPPASLEISVRMRSVFVDPYLTTHTGRPARAGRRYTVRWRPDASVRSSSVGGVEPLNVWDRSRYLQAPRLSEDFDELARRIAVDRQSGLETAEAVEEFLRSEYRYSLVTPSRRRDDPIEDFLFEARAGHCEYFATAMVLLLRSRGVPSRLVTGFLRGEVNELGDFEVIRKADAHAWVEVFDDQRGWVAFDPTPPLPAAAQARGLDFLFQGIDSFRMFWDMYVIAYDYDRQQSILGGAAFLVDRLSVSGNRAVELVRTRARLLGGIGVFLLLVFLAFRSRLGLRWRWTLRILWPFRRASLGGRPGSAVRFYEELLRQLERVGFPKSAGTTPAEYARSLEERLPGISELTFTYYGVRYGGHVLSRDQRARADWLVAAIQGAALANVDLAGGLSVRAGRA